MKIKINESELTNIIMAEVKRSINNMNRKQSNMLMEEFENDNENEYYFEFEQDNNGQRAFEYLFSREIPQLFCYMINNAYVIDATSCNPSLQDKIWKYLMRQRVNFINYPEPERMR